MEVFETTNSPHEDTQDNPAKGATEDSAGQWQLIGYFFIICGVAGFGYALNMEVAVSSYNPMEADIVNLQLLFNKGATLAISMAGLAAGLFCLATSSILNAIGSR